MHTSQIHQHVEKNSVLLKEVLTHRGEHARGAFVDNIVLHSRDDADGARKCDAGECQYCRKRLRCRCFRHSHIDHRDAVELKATDRYQQKADCVDSESCFLATKKFLWFWPGIGRSLAKTAFLRESPPPIRRYGFSSRRCIDARAPINRGGGDHAGTASTRRSDAEFGFEQIVHCLWIGLAAG